MAERRRLARDREVDRGRGVQVPGMIEIQVRYVGTHALGVREACEPVLRGVGRKRAGLADRLSDRVARDIRSARAALAGAAVDGHADAPVVGVLETLDVAEPRRRCKADIVAHGNLGLVCTASPRLIQHAGNDVFERLPPE